MLVILHLKKKKAMQALDRVGLAHLAGQKAANLSGGQQQRVAIARALVQDAKVILADEPIASLDPKSARQVMDMLEAINEEDGKTVIVTLHQVGVARKYCKSMIALREGKLYFEGKKEDLTNEKLMELYGGDVSEMLDDEGYSDGSPNATNSSRSETSLPMHLLDKQPALKGLLSEKSNRFNVYENNSPAKV